MFAAREKLSIVTNTAHKTFVRMYFLETLMT